VCNVWDSDERVRVESECETIFVCVDSRILVCRVYNKIDSLYFSLTHLHYQVYREASGMIHITGSDEHDVCIHVRGKVWGNVDVYTYACIYVIMCVCLFVCLCISYISDCIHHCHAWKVVFAQGVVSAQEVHLLLWGERDREKESV